MAIILFSGRLGEGMSYQSFARITDMQIRLQQLHKLEYTMLDVRRCFIALGETKSVSVVDALLTLIHQRTDE
ncbi:hypothetical protein [Janthinobacterium sp. J1-1]|uniref:hypothetical protein n=1 Tax=Janthinobacterium sp. J1-1 TaxID=3065910 RepID=UPI002810D58E|nr:hypothetical protein [Janthinobacterium sp. J1-1]